MVIGFFGTPNHARELLQSIVESGHQVAFVVTNPDKPRGRDKRPSPPPVKEYAQAQGIPVFQPEKLKLSQEKESILKIPTDLHIVYAYGQIIPEEIFMSPKLGSINLHGSLLPEYRGAAPIQAAILDGKEKTGYTIQKISKEMDAGDILYQEEIPIGEDDTTESILQQITQKGGKKILELLDKGGPFSGIPQDHSKATYCKKILPEDRILDFKFDHRRVHNKIRAFYPEPLAYTYFRGKRILLLRSSLKNTQPVPDPETKPGSLWKIGKNLLYVSCGDQIMLSIEELQPEGKKPMKALDFLNGFRVEKGDFFGEAELERN